MYNKYGVIEGVKEYDNLYKITNLVEKPKFPEAPSDLAIIGRYILTPIFLIYSRTLVSERRGNTIDGCTPRFTEKTLNVWIYL